MTTASIIMRRCISLCVDSPCDASKKYLSLARLWAIRSGRPHMAQSLKNMILKMEGSNV